MNLARLFMLGNLSANIVLPDELPDWLEKIPKAQRKWAWGEYQSKLKAAEWKKYKEQQSRAVAQIPKERYPEWISEFPEDQRDEMWKAYVRGDFSKGKGATFPAQMPEWLKQIPSDLRKTAFDAVLRKSYELSKDAQFPIKELSPGRDVRAEWEEYFQKVESGEFPPVPGQFSKPNVSEIERIIKENRESAEIRGGVRTLRNEMEQVLYPEIFEQSVQDSLEAFYNHAETANKLIIEANEQSAKASNLPDIKNAATILGQAKDSISKAVATKNAFRTFFDKRTQANQEEIINRLSENLSRATQSIYPKKFKYTLEPLETARENILRLSKKLVSGEASAESINAIQTGIRGLQKFASMILSMPNVSDQERLKAKETLLLSESMKTIARNYKEEFVKEIKVPSEQFYYREDLKQGIKQRHDLEILSKAIDLMSAAFIKEGNPEERATSLDVFSQAAKNFGTNVKLDPSLIPLLEKTIDRSIPTMKSFASVMTRSISKDAYRTFENSEAYKTFQSGIKKWLKSSGQWPKGAYDNSDKIRQISMMPFLDPMDKAEKIHELLEDEENHEDGWWEKNDTGVSVRYNEAPEIQQARKTVMKEWTIKLLPSIVHVRSGLELDLDKAQNNAFRSLMALKTFIQMSKEGQIHIPPR
jgi:hypothetical protein